MATTLAHTFESGQSAGTTVTTVNSATGGDAFASVTIGTGAGVTYAASPFRGTLCLRCTTSGTSAQAFATWTTAFTAASRVYLRATIRVDTIAAGMAVVRLRGGGVQTARIAVTAAGKLELRDSGNTPRATSSASMTAASTVWRIALDVTVGASSTAILYIYYSATSTTPDETLTASAQNWGTSNVDEISWGFVGAVASADLLLKDVVATSVALPGPPAQSASLSESVSFTDALARQQTSARSLAETVTLTDALARQQSASRPLAEALTVVDAATRTLVLPRALSESVSTADAVTRALAQARGVTEQVALVDAVGRAYAASRELAEALSFADAVTAEAADVPALIPGVLAASAPAADLTAAADRPTLTATAPRTAVLSATTSP